MNRASRGSGRTRLAQSVCEGLGVSTITQTVCSPSFRDRTYLLVLLLKFVAGGSGVGVVDQSHGYGRNKLAFYSKFVSKTEIWKRLQGLQRPVVIHGEQPLGEAVSPLPSLSLTPL